MKYEFKRKMKGPTTQLDDGLAIDTELHTIKGVLHNGVTVPIPMTGP